MYISMNNHFMRGPRVTLPAGRPDVTSIFVMVLSLTWSLYFVRKFSAALRKGCSLLELATIVQACVEEERGKQ